MLDTVMSKCRTETSASVKGVGEVPLSRDGASQRIHNALASASTAAMSPPVVLDVIECKG